MGWRLLTIARIVLFIVLSGFFVFISWRPLHNPQSHGFYRFFAFEGILILILLNIPFWLREPFSPLQLISWAFLLCSILFAPQGFFLLRKLGDIRARKTDPENLKFENTVNLVSDGIYKFIRHPLYSSLLLLAWGALLKHVTAYGISVVLVTTGFLVATAKMEERENISFFGSQYKEYMEKTKMFIPYLF
jgi:protein-S-isoprenylcysteine O-methyltransferase Ste14